jgi:hypothetical protein
MKMKIAIIIGNEQKDFFQSLGEYLLKNKNADVTFLAHSDYVKSCIKKHMPNFSKIVVLDEHLIKTKESELMLVAERIEKDHNTTISSLISQDRGLGQGYFANVPNVPHIKRSVWSQSKKIKSIASEYIKYVELLSGKDILIQQYPISLIKMACEKVNCLSFSLVQSRYGNRYLWSDNSYLTSSSLISKLQVELKSFSSEKECNYEKDEGGLSVLNDASFKLTSKLKTAIFLTYNETKKIIRGSVNKDSYVLYGWIPVALRSWANFKFLKKISINPEVVKDKKIVFWAMNLEPEVSLYLFSPEFSNSLEAITWISKSVDIGTVVVIKEHPLALGVRSKKIYKIMSKMANVYFADPELSSEVWLQKSSMVATITGTIGYEAVYSKIPVISFGKHQLINYLPTVEYVTNFSETKASIEKLSNLNHYDLYKSSVSLHNALIDQSFEVPNFYKEFLNKDERSAIGKLTADKLISRYPDKFKSFIS